MIHTYLHILHIERDIRFAQMFPKMSGDLEMGEFDLKQDSVGEVDQTTQESV